MSPQREPDFFRMESSVPLFTGELLQSAYILAFVWSFVVGAISFFTDFLFDGVRWFIVTLLVGFAIHFASYFFKKRRFEDPVTDDTFLHLLEEVKMDIGTGNEVRFWRRESDRQIFASTVNVFYKAILLSDGVVVDMLDKPDKAKVVLATEILELEKKHPVSRMTLGVLYFMLMSLLATAFLMDGILFSLFSLGPALLVGIVIAVLVIFAGIPILMTREDKDLNERIEAIYGIPPDAAKLEVLVGVTVPQELIDEVKREEEEGPSQRFKAIKVAAPTAIIVLPVAFVIFATMSGLDSQFDVLFSVLMAGVIAGGAFVMVFITALMWPIIRPGGEPRDNKHDFQDRFTEGVQQVINKEEGFERAIVRGVRLPFDEETGLVVFEVDYEGKEKTLEALMPQTLKDIRDPELAGPVLISEMKRDVIEKKLNRMSYGVLGIGILILVFGLVLPLINYGFSYIWPNFLIVLGFYLLITMTPLVAGSLWKRRAEIDSDVDVAMKYPRFIEALETLIARHHSLPYGITSYKTRLERIRSKLGDEGERRELGLGLQ